MPYPMDGAVLARKTAIVEARRMTRDFQVRTSTGDVLSGHAGDYLVTQPGSSNSVVDLDIFDETYGPVVRYQKAALVRAKQHPLDAPPIVVQTLEGPVTCNPGDYVLEGTHGEQWPVPRDFFETNYASASAGDTRMPGATPVPRDPDAAPHAWVAAASFFDSHYIPDMSHVAGLPLAGTEHFRVLASMLMLQSFTVHQLARFSHVPSRSVQGVLLHHLDLVHREGRDPVHFSITADHETELIHAVNDNWRSTILPRLMDNPFVADLVDSAYATTEQLLGAAQQADPQERRALLAAAGTELAASRENLTAAAAELRRRGDLRAADLDQRIRRAAAAQPELT